MSFLRFNFYCFASYVLLEQNVENYMHFSHNVNKHTITKTRLFKYIENFTTKNWKFSDKNSDIHHENIPI